MDPLPWGRRKCAFVKSELGSHKKFVWDRSGETPTNGHRVFPVALAKRRVVSQSRPVGLQAGAAVQAGPSTRQPPLPRAISPLGTGTHCACPTVVCPSVLRDRASQKTKALFPPTVLGARQTLTHGSSDADRKGEKRGVLCCSLGPTGSATEGCAQTWPRDSPQPPGAHTL